MRAEWLQPGTAAAAEIVGLVVAHDVPRPGGAKGYALRKGQVLTAADLPALRQLDGAVIHVIRPEEGDIGEEEAGRRLAQAVAGPGVTLKPAAQARVNLIAAHRGLVQIAVEMLTALNSVDGVAVFTLFDGQPVEAGEVVAGAKIAPLVMAGPTLKEAERLASTVRDSLVRVLPFRPTRIAVLYREKLAATARARFGEAVRQKAAWFGSGVMAITPVSDDPEEIATELRRFVRAGAGLIFAAGGSSTDPLDPTIVALEVAGAHMIRRGVPVHPGSMFWMAELDGVPVLSLASCSLFSQATIVDVVLPPLLAGLPVTAADLAALGHGGLMERGHHYRFPLYARPAGER